MCPKVSSHLALLGRTGAGRRRQEPERTQQAPVRVLLRQAPALEQVLRQPGPGAQEPERLQCQDRRFLYLRLPGGTGFGLSAASTGAGAAADLGSAFASEVAGPAGGPQVVNKTQPGKNQGP